MTIQADYTTPAIGWANVWPTDLALAQEPDFERALEILRRDVYLYWDKKYGAFAEKEACEIEDFLDYLIKHQCQYDSLLPKQQNLLQNARRIHYNFWRKVDKAIELI